MTWNEYISQRIDRLRAQLVDETIDELRRAQYHRAARIAHDEAMRFAKEAGVALPAMRIRTVLHPSCIRLQTEPVNRDDCANIYGATIPPTVRSRMVSQLDVFIPL